MSLVRIFVSIGDPARRAALIRALRTDPEVRLVGTEAEAELVLTEAGARQIAADLAPALAGPVQEGEPLTPREVQVLQLVAAGLGNAEVASQLGISPSTVKYHLSAIYAKLGVRTRTEAVATGIRRGMVSL